MADWRDRAEINQDVAFFHYASQKIEQEAREIYIWDLDKTYLDTKFESIKGLVKTAVEKAFQKRNVPGTATLVRALRNSWQERHSGQKDFPIYFITASPPQMERKIHQKLNYDGIYPFGIFFKDNLQNLRPSRLWRLNKQVGFKLQSLLQMRTHLGERVREILWGDDSEADAVIYSLYSDICARRMNEREIAQTLKALHVTGEQLDVILELQGQIPAQDPVEKIYINLADDTDPEYYAKFGRRTLPTYNSFQAALDLFQDQRLNAEQVVVVGLDMMNNFGFTSEELQSSFEDMIRRKILGRESVEQLLPKLKSSKLFFDRFASELEAAPVSLRVGERVFELEGHYEPWVPDRIDYLHDYR